MKSRHSFLILLGVLILSGCSKFKDFSFRSQSPEEPEDTKPTTRLVSDLAVPFGMTWVKVEAVSLVTNLHGTGADLGPTPQRAALVAEMETLGVKNPNAVLSSRNTSLVLVQGLLRPGIQKGDRFDVEVRVPGQSETTSLRGGWLMETRLSEMALLGNQWHRGNHLATAKGAVMIDPVTKGSQDQVRPTRGRVLGGGVALKSRDMGLALRAEHQNVFNASRIANAVNKRFHSFDKGVQVGVAKAKTDKHIVLTVHPRYKDNVNRYMRVIEAIGLNETDAQRSERIARLKKELLDPETASEAAVQLEAIGGNLAIEPLLAAAKSKDAVVRFCAAESLAYLDRREAAEPLGQIARDEPAFRVFALTALSAMDDYGAAEQLRALLDAQSAETRYGAFRALWAMNANDPAIAGEQFGDEFDYHVLDTSGPPMIHMTHNRRAELVLFGKEQRLQAPFALSAGNQILVKNLGADEVSVSRFAPDSPDQKRVVSMALDEVIRAIVDLGGTYPDVVQAIQEAKSAGALAARVEVDALPEVGRVYQRPAIAGEKGKLNPSNPAPELFAPLGFNKAKEPSSDDEEETAEKPEKKRWGSRFFAKMTGRASE